MEMSLSISVASLIKHLNHKLKQLGDMLDMSSVETNIGLIHAMRCLVVVQEAMRRVIENSG